MNGTVLGTANDADKGTVLYESTPEKHALRLDKVRQIARFLDKLNTRWAVAIALVVFLLINGFLYSRYQQLEGDAAISTVVDPEATTAEETIVSPSRETDTSNTATVPAAEQEKELATDEEVPATKEAVPSPIAGEDAYPIRVRVMVVGAPSWLRVQEDKQIVLEQVSEPGFSREFVADRRISVEAGNAGAVWVEVEGSNMGSLGADGEVVTRTFTT